MAAAVDLVAVVAAADLEDAEAEVAVDLEDVEVEVVEVPVWVEVEVTETTLATKKFEKAKFELSGQLFEIFVSQIKYCASPEMRYWRWSIVRYWMEPLVLLIWTPTWVPPGTVYTLRQ